ncbi:hypothetical protein FGB62_20g116 [Gracilaria domingensis]|nr:hypothetical protein FGB62_20g116 [Gracilaria domingensis]
MYVVHWTHNATAADWDPLQRKYSAKASMSFRVSGRAGWAGSNLFHPNNVRRDNPKAFLSKGSASERNAISTLSKSSGEAADGSRVTRKVLYARMYIIRVLSVAAKISD